MEDPDWLPPDMRGDDDRRKRKTSPAPKDTQNKKLKEEELEGGRPAVTIQDHEVMLDNTRLAHRPLRVASFNIQVFGRKKLKNKEVEEILKKILRRYDVIVVLEIRDRSNTALDKLVESVNSVDPDNPFEAVVSERLGRTNSKEQYAIMYRSKLIKVADTYQYDDGEDNGKDTFQREPFAVRFYSPTTEITDFAIIAIHTDPDDAVKEINGLYKVYEVTKKHWGMPNIIIAGDFNADEGYVQQDDWAKIALHNDRRFKWLIDDETDTTTKNTDRAYDRFVVAGKELNRNIVPGSAGAYKFDEDLGISDELAQDVSDHYPIELEIQGKINRAVQEHITSSLSFTVTQQTEPPARAALVNLTEIPFGEDSAYFHCDTRFNEDGGKKFEAVLHRERVGDVTEALLGFHSKFPDVLADGTIATARALVESSLMKERPYVYGLISGKAREVHDFNVTVQVKREFGLFEVCVTVARWLS